MLELFVVVNCGPCAPFIGKCLASLKSQTYRNWHAMVTVDPCGDQTYEAAVAAAHGDRRISVHRNSIRRYSLENLIRAIEQASLGPEDVIVILDGDDWLNVDHGLAVVAEAYNKHRLLVNVWKLGMRQLGPAERAVAGISGWHRRLPRRTMAGNPPANLEEMAVGPP